MVLAAGTRLGHYDIIGPLGSGGMGVVYRGRDTRLDRLVAIKVLSAALAGEPGFRDRFDREARTISALNHPNIAQLYAVVDLPRDAGIQDSAMVMELIDGESLAASLQSTPMAERVYAQVGFRDLGLWQEYVPAAVG